MSPLEVLLRERIVSGLRRHTISTCSKWAETYRIMGQPFPGPWTFKYHPWTKEIHDSQDEHVVCQKGAQLGFTEVALNKTFYNIDIKGASVLYILPASTPDAHDFSTSRFDPALELSTYLNNLFTDVQNIGHKRAGSANLFIRGSRSRSQLKSLPVALLIYDEVDEMVQENIPLAVERLSGQSEKQDLKISTPTIENQGINAYYKDSTQNHYYFKCPFCNRWTELLFPDCLVVKEDNIQDSELICKECHHKLHHETKSEWLSYPNARWIPTHTDKQIVGYHINQLYSMAPVCRPDVIARAWIKSQTNPADEQEFYNNKLGITHTPKGAKISDQNIDNCLQASPKYAKTTDRPNGTAIITMGIDVGKWLHYEVDQWFLETNSRSPDINIMATCKVLIEGKVLNFEELDNLLHVFKPLHVVIDANPEKRKAFEFAQRFWGRVKLCYYGNDVSGKRISVHSEEEQAITVDRTSWLDLSLGRFLNQRIQLPFDISREYRDHMKALTRIYRRDKNGNLVGRYEKASNDEDHYAHARNYSEIALPFALSMINSTNIVGSIV